MFKIYPLMSALMLFSAIGAHAQSKIKDGTIPSSSLPNVNAVLELESNKRGFLLPRIALQGTSFSAPLSAHVAGMVIYNTATVGAGITAVSPGYYYNDGTKWNRLSPSGEVQLNSTALVSSSSPAGTVLGQMMYNTNAASGVPVGPVYWDGAKWVSAAPGAANPVVLTSPTSPAGLSEGQVAYNTGSIEPKGLIYWDGTQWKAVNSANSVTLTSPTSPAGASVGQTAYNTGTVEPKGLIYWDGTQWKAVNSANSVTLTSPTSPAGASVGQTAYNTGTVEPKGLVYWDGTQWKAVNSSNPVVLTSSTSPAGASIGQTAYNTGTVEPKGLIYWDGTQWKAVNSSNPVVLTSATSPAGASIGQTAYNTGTVEPKGLIYWDGTQWKAVNSSNPVVLTSSTSPAGASIGQTAYNTGTVQPTGLVYWDGTQWKAVNNANSVALSSATSPAGAAVGEMIYNTNASSGLAVGPAYWDGTKWVSQVPGTTTPTVLTSASSPAGTSLGQVAYNTSSVEPKGLIYWDGTQWKAVNSANSLTLTSPTAPAGASVGQTAYNTSSVEPRGLVYWDGTQWKAVNAANSIVLTSPTAPAGASVGQTAYNTGTTQPTGLVYWDGTQWKTVNTANSVALSSTTSPAGAAVGETIYNTNASSGLAVGPAYWDGTQWVTQVSTSSASNGLTVVSGDVRLGGTLTANTTIAQATNSLNFTSTASTGTSHFTVDGTTLNVDAVNNRVGIGTATPVVSLDTRGSIHVDDASTAATANQQGGYLTWNRANVGGVGGSNGGNVGFLNHQGTGSGGFVFTTTNDNTTFNERMRITGGGFVGIGSTAPTAALQIVNNATGNDNKDDVVIRSFGAANSSGFSVQKSFGTETTPSDINAGTFLGSYSFGGRWNNAYNFGASSISSIYRGNGTTSLTDMTFTTSNATRMYINENGNVGIATTTPNAALQFANVLSNRRLVLWEGGNNDHQFYGFGMNGGTLRYQVDNTGANHSFFAGTGTGSSNELMRITGTGLVGIGTTNPGNRLEVNSGTSGASGLRFTNMNNSSAASTSGIATLGVNSNGDVVVASSQTADILARGRFTFGDLCCGAISGISVSGNVNISSVNKLDANRVQVNFINSVPTTAFVLFQLRNNALAAAGYIESQDLSNVIIRLDEWASIAQNVIIDFMVLR